jgi:hypothetical protein
LSELFAIRKIGTAYSNLGNTDSALYIFNMILPAFREIGHRKYEAYVMNDIGIQNPWLSGKPYFENSLLIMRDIGFSYGVGVRLENLGGTYLYGTDPPDLDKALNYFIEAGSEYQRINRFASMAANYTKIADVYIEKGEYNDAIQSLNYGLIAINKFNKSIDTMVYEDPAKKLREYILAKRSLGYIYEDFEIIYEKTDDFEKALYYHKLKENAEDSVYLERNRILIDVSLANTEENILIQKMDLLEKDKQLQENKAERALYFIIGLAILITLVIIIAVILIRQNKLRTNQEKTTLQHRLLRSQMNPHFIFNSLASIQNTIVNEESVRASKYLARFSKLVRNILDSSVEEYITLEEETSTIENYLELQKVRFPDKFEYEVTVNEKLQLESIKFPPMLSQPFIENSIEHGFKGLNQKGKIEIRFIPESDYLILEIEDNGIGRKKALKIMQEQNKEHKSLATILTMERIKVLNKKLKQKIHFEIIDLKDENGNAAGTKVVFEVPLSL